jgi:hypothetical protein
MIGSNCLDRADFADPGKSPYILPYPVGESHPLDQSYCTFGRSHADQLAYDFGMELGDAVEAGQVIARVGHSGMPTNYRSVLHFGVYASWPALDGNDVAINFRNTEGALDLRNGLAAGKD